MDIYKLNLIYFNINQSLPYFKAFIIEQYACLIKLLYFICINLFTTLTEFL